MIAITNQQPSIERLLVQVESWKAIARSYQSQADSKLMNDLTEATTRLSIMEQQLAASERELATVTDQRDAALLRIESVATAQQDFAGADAALDRIRTLHRQEGDVCDYCFSITTDPKAYGWPCQTIRTLEQQ